MRNAILLIVLLILTISIYGANKKISLVLEYSTNYYAKITYDCFNLKYKYKSFQNIDTLKMETDCIIKKDASNGLGSKVWAYYPEQFKAVLYLNSDTSIYYHFHNNQYRYVYSPSTSGIETLLSKVPYFNTSELLVSIRAYNILGKAKFEPNYFYNNRYCYKITCEDKGRVITAIFNKSDYSVSYISFQSKENFYSGVQFEEYSFQTIDVDLEKIIKSNNLFSIASLASSFGSYKKCLMEQNKSKIGFNCVGDFIFMNTDSTILPLESYYGEVILVDFWYFGCKACLELAPTLNKYQKKYQKKGLKVIAVNAFDNNLVSIEEYKLQNKYKFHVAFDDRKISQALTRGYPYILLFDRKGQLISSYFGLTNEERSKLIDQISLNL